MEKSSHTNRLFLFETATCTALPQPYEQAKSPLKGIRFLKQENEGTIPFHCCNKQAEKKNARFYSTLLNLAAKTAYLRQQFSRYPR